jgi:type II secretory pathway pseudopilin PulG
MMLRGPARAHCRRSQESGYAYLMALFMVLIVIVGSTVVLENAAIQGRRAREDEMMWRGKQYVRAIKLYYRKTGHYPQDLDTLQKGVGNVHFLRGAYPDPMNKNEDGKWRFIYTNASGAIIGSVRYATMQQMAILDLNGGIIPGVQGGDSNSQDSNVTPVPQPDEGNCPTPVGGSNPSAPQPVSGIGSQGQPNPSQPFGSQPNPGQAGDVNANQPPSGSQPGCPQVQQGSQQVGQPSGGLFGGNASSQNAFGVGQFNPASGPPGSAFGLTPQSLQALAQMKPTGPVDSPVIGGFLVGIGSTVDQKSLKVYKHGKKYKDWEFIWNPLEDQARAVQQGINQAGMGAAFGMPGSQPGGANGNGFGGGFGSQPGPTGPTGTSGTTSGSSQPPSGPQ